MPVLVVLGLLLAAGPVGLLAGGHQRQAPAPRTTLADIARRAGRTLKEFDGGRAATNPPVTGRFVPAEGKEGVAFGLFTTTGRAASFLAPWLFSAFIDMFGTDRAGMGGLCVVLAAGLTGMLMVRAPARSLATVP